MTAMPDEPVVGGHVYVVRFTDGMIKVGHTTRPTARLGQHRSDARWRGQTIVEQWVSPPHVQYVHNEGALIRWCVKQPGAQLARGMEWFTGLDFEATMAYAAELPMLRVETGRALQIPRYPLMHIRRSSVPAVWAFQDALAAAQLHDMYGAGEDGTGPWVDGPTALIVEALLRAGWKPPVDGSKAEAARQR